MYHILKKENYFDKIQMIQLWNQCNNDTQQNTFHKLVVDKVLKSIYFLIYDCQFQPDSETNQWLNNMKSIDILPFKSIIIFVSSKLIIGCLSLLLRIINFTISF